METSLLVQDSSLSLHLLVYGFADDLALADVILHGGFLHLLILVFPDAIRSLDEVGHYRTAVTIDSSS